MFFVSDKSISRGRLKENCSHKIDHTKCKATMTTFSCFFLLVTVKKSDKHLWMHKHSTQNYFIDNK